MDDSTAALINAGTQVAGQAASAIATSSINRKTRKWNEQMWTKQRDQDLANWNASNEYNAPAAQMKRLQDAGLNPYMVYGNQSAWSGGSSSPASTPSTPSWSPKAPDVGAAVTGGISAYVDTRVKQAQLDNMKAQNNLIAAQTYNTIMSANTSEFNLGMKKQLEDTSLEAARVALDSLKSDSDIKYSDAKARPILNDQRIDLQKADLGLKSIQTQEQKTRIENLRRSGALQDFEINLRKQGVNSNDPVYLRMLTQFLTKMGVL